MKKRKRIIIGLLTLSVFVAGLIVAVWLIRERTNIFPRATGETASIYFLPSSATFSPTVLVDLMVDTNTSKLIFSRISVSFDKNKIRLDGLNTHGLFSTVIAKTTTAQANISGQIDLVLAVPPLATPSAGLMQLADLTFSKLSTTENDSTQVNVITDNIQLVNSLDQEIPATSSGVILLINPVNSPSPTLNFTPTPTLIPTTILTSIPTNPASTVNPTQPPSPVPTIPSSGITINSTVNTSSDDAEENSVSHSVTINSSDLELVKDNELQTVGLRFNNISVPKGAIVTDAYINFTVDEMQSETTSLSFYGQAADNAATFITTTGDISGRLKTNSKVDWNNIPAWVTVKAKVQTPDLSPIIQEIVNRSGWNSNNSLAIIVTGIGHRTAMSFDYYGAVYAPVLTINYSTP